MKNFHDIEITIYRGVRDTTGYKSTLFNFLENVDIDAIKELRATTDPERRREIKLSLLQATISGVFAPSRSAENLVKHSGLICIDVDRKDNEHIANFDSLINDVFRHMQEVAYAAHSVSGNGYFLIIPLKYPHRHKEQFQMLVRLFAEYGIVVDKACGDVCRLRCQSFDLHQYINMSAKPFAGVYRELKQNLSYNFSAIGEEEEKVAQLCRQIASRHIDLTANYDDWVKIGMALSSFGESGRQWFHLCSQQNPKYRSNECDRKFTSFLRGSHRITLGTFFHLCRQAGITFST